MRHATTYFSALLLVAPIFLASCEGGWHSEDEVNYLKSCRVQNAHLYADSLRTETYCRCNLDSVKAIYPVFNDVVRNKDSARVRQALLYCSGLAQQ